MHIYNLKRVLALASSLAVSACSYGNVGMAENHVEAASDDSYRYLEQSRHQLVPQAVDRVRLRDEVWTGSVSRRNDRGSPLPGAWERTDAFVLRRGAPLSIYEIGSSVTEITGIPVTFSPDVAEQGAAAAPPAALAAAARAPGAPPDLTAMLGGLSLGGGPSANASNVVGGQIRPVSGNRQTMRANFQGRLSQFMNQLSAHFGVGWEYSAGEIRVFRSITRTYTVNALPSAITLNSSLSADSSTATGGAGGATSSSNQKVSSSVIIQIWDDITKTVEGIVGSQGKVTTAVSTGTITVTAPSTVVQHVQAYLDGQNERLGRQVTVSVTVLAVEMNDGDNTVLDVGGLFNRAGSFGLTLGTPAGVAAGTTAIASLANGAATAVGLNGLGRSSSPGGGAGFNVANPNSSFNGTNAIAQALATKGRVSVRTQATVTTLNGVPAPMQVANTRGYVKSVSVSDGTTSGSSTSSTRTSIVPDSVTTGFSMSLLPRIDPDGSSVMMQYNINLSELVGSVNGFETFTSPDGRATVQLPNVNMRNFVEQARVPNGSTLVLTGFEQSNNTASRQGSLGNPAFMGLGGSQNGRRTRTAIVVLMTPTVVSDKVISSE